MRRIILICIISIAIVNVACPLLSDVISENMGDLESAAIETPQVATQVKYTRPHETIVYDVKMGELTVGEAVFDSTKTGQINGKVVNVVTLDTSLATFRDTETIYSDPDTFLPLKIERKIRSFIVEENIVETYDQNNYVLTIARLNGTAKKEETIKKDGVIHNAILLPYQARRERNLDLGWSLLVDLPNKKFQIELVSIEEVKVPAGTFNAYHFKSMPNLFEVWLTADERRVPVKIKGMDSVGYTLVMRKEALEAPPSPQEPLTISNLK